MSIPVRDTPQAFGAISVLLHWMVAMLVFLQLATALIMAIWLPNRMATSLVTPLGVLDRLGVVLIHEAFGLVLLPIVIARILWRLGSGKPAAARQHPSLMLLASIVWRGLLIGTAIQVITGPLSLLFYGYPLQFFSLVLFPALHSKADVAHDLSKAIHHLAGWSILGMLALHVGGALRHAVIDHDGVLGRMIFPGRVLQGRLGKSARDGDIRPVMDATSAEGEVSVSALCEGADRLLRGQFTRLG